MQVPEGGHCSDTDCGILAQAQTAKFDWVLLLGQLEEDSKGKLAGIAKLGKRAMPAPEYSSGDGLESLRRLTWRVIYADTCYYLSYTVTQRFSLSQIAINGYVVCSRKHSVFQQVCYPALVVLMAQNTGPLVGIEHLAYEEQHNVLPSSE